MGFNKSGCDTPSAKFVSSVRIVALGIAISMTITSCATSTGGAAGAGSAGISGATTKCVGTVLLGALLGAAVGAAASNKGAALGAGVGAAAGGVACAVILALDAQDKKRIAEAQSEALRTNKPVELSYKGTDGLARQISVKPMDSVAQSPQTPSPAQGNERLSAEAGAAKGTRICREVETTASIETKGTAAVPKQQFCRNESGDWIPS